MKRQIRKNIFESNSSSMHSLVIMKNEGMYTTEEIMNGIWLSKDKNGERCVWHLYNSELYFGRSPFSVLATFEKKWRYACASMVIEYNDDIYKELEDIAIKYIPNLKKIKLPKENTGFPSKEAKRAENSVYAQTYGKTEEELQEYLKEKAEKWNIDKIEYWIDSIDWWCFEKPDTGMVDENVLAGFLEKEKISLEEFITNKKYIVIQDGDEYCVYETIKNAGLVDMDKIEREYPNYDE